MNFFEDDIKQSADSPVIESEPVNLGLPDNDQTDYSFNLKKSNRQTILLLAVCAASIALVYFAGFMHKPSADKQEEAAAGDLDLVLAKLVGISSVDDSQQLIDAFYELPGGKQVTLDELNKNPFLLEVKNTPELQVEIKEQEADMHKQLDEDFSKLVLGGIMRGYQSDMCLINGQIYKTGDSVAGGFEIVEIKTDSVVLQAQEIKYTLGIK